MPLQAASWTACASGQHGSSALPQGPCRPRPAAALCPPAHSRLSPHAVAGDAMQDYHQEIQDVMGTAFGVPEDIDEEELMVGGWRSRPRPAPLWVGPAAGARSSGTRSTCTYTRHCVHQQRGPSGDVSPATSPACVQGELDALEDDMMTESAQPGGVPAYLQVGGCLPPCRASARQQRQAAGSSGRSNSSSSGQAGRQAGSSPQCIIFSVQWRLPVRAKATRIHKLRARCTVPLRRTLTCPRCRRVSRSKREQQRMSLVCPQCRSARDAAAAPSVFAPCLLF